MKAFMLDGFVDISSFFDEFISRNDILEKSENIQFLIFNPDFTSIEYIYNSVEALAVKEDIESFKNLVSENDPVKTSGFTEIHVSQIGEKTNIYVSAVNPLIEPKIYIATMNLQFENKIVPDNIISEINLITAEYFLYNIQAVITNYEKLYYLIDAYCEMLSAKDPLMPHHMSNVANWSIKIANELEINERDTKILYIAALLHDVGKLFIPDSIINRPEKLTDKEKEIVNKHCVNGYNLLKSSLYGMTFFNDIPKIVKYHHERYDGKGYPDGLSGEEIPYLSRIVATAESIDFMMSKRPGIDAKEPHEIIGELKMLSGQQFDPDIARAAINAIEDNYENTRTMVMKKSKFIINASLRFYFGDFKTICTLQGNIVLKNEKAIFILASGAEYNPSWVVSRIFLPTICFSENKDFYEFKCSIESLSPESIEISQISYTPTDKFFSLVLESIIKLKKDEFEMDVDMMKLGGDTLVFKVNPQDSEKITENLGGSFDVILDKETAEKSGVKKVKCRIAKMYNSVGNMVYVLNYVDMSSTTRDDILRFLFKKQVEYKQKIKTGR